MTQHPVPALPPVSAEYLDTLHNSDPGGAPKQSASRLYRSANGMTRMDFEASSVINDPVNQKTVLLDHAKKEAKIMSMQQAGLPQFAQPQFAAGVAPAMPAPPPPMHIQDLGKRMIDGHEVMGKKYTFQPPPLPQVGPPAMPAIPKPPEVHVPAVPGVPHAAGLAGLPALPEAPKAPGLTGGPHIPAVPPPPQAPPLPLPPSVMEVWTSTSLLIPLLSRMKGGFGQRISQCKNPIPGEPHPAVFQIPPGYSMG